MKKKKDKDYIKMVDEMAELVDEGMDVDEALEKIKKKYKLNKEEGEELYDFYIKYCHEDTRVDEFDDGIEQELDEHEDDDFFGEDIDFDNL